MSKRLIVGNWKMNLLRKEARLLAKRIVDELAALPAQVDVVLAPPFTNLDVVYEEIRGRAIELGAQNVCWAESGEFTGEISPGMLLDAGCKWVIVGHSERRKYFGETDAMVRDKVGACLSAGLTPILCVGETWKERQEGRTEEVITSQLRSALRGLSITNPRTLVIAYEPVWAIGSGKTPKPEEIGFVNDLIRDIIRDIGVNSGGEVRLLYGGSVSEYNIEYLLSAEIEGALVGGASLRAEAFVKIVGASGVH